MEVPEETLTVAWQPPGWFPTLGPPWTELAWSGLLLLVAILGSLLLYGLIVGALRRAARSTEVALDDVVLRAINRRSRTALRFLVPLIVIGLLLPLLPLDAFDLTYVRRVHVVILTAVGAWLLVTLTQAAEDVVVDRYDIQAQDNLRARTLHTQVKVFKNVVNFLIVVFGLAAVLMSIPAVRQIGVSLLASAGVAGVIVGFAAQRSIATIIAGVQIAITQPVRMDDVVIVEGEWGRIEEITLTYVVVRIWDLRRLVVPITWFIEKPFQNWTRSTSALLGTVFLKTDYTVPVEEVRAALKEILDASEQWDGETWGLQVTDADDRTMTLRALMSAPDSGTAWNLRCEVREKLIAWLQEAYPDALPRLRAEVEDRARQAERAVAK